MKAWLLKIEMLNKLNTDNRCIAGNIRPEDQHNVTLQPNDKNWSPTSQPIYRPTYLQ